MNNKQVAQAFVDGARKGQGSNFHIEYDDLYSYRTLVARRTLTGGIAVNPIKYSSSTGRQMGHLYAALSANGFEAPTDEDDHIEPTVFYDCGYCTSAAKYRLVKFPTYRQKGGQS